MSFGGISLTGSIRNTVSLRSIGDQFAFYRQAAIKEAELAAQEAFKEYTPVLTGALVFSSYTHENQYAMWVGIAGTLDGRPYGFAQEYGWHDRGGAFHSGHHMVEQAASAAADAFLAFLGGNAFARINPAVHQYFSPGISMDDLHRGQSPTYG